VNACVLNTDVLATAFRSDQGASRQLVLAALARRFELVLSVPLVFEYEAVLTRPEHLRASGASNRDVREVLDALVAVAKQMRLAFR
jgi:predicted nucleic acid-binding protein